MKEEKIPINKGNYSMDDPERDKRMDEIKAGGWEKEYAEYRKNWVEYPRNLVVSEYPLLVDIELASVCNLRCPMCYTISPQFKQKVNAKLMDWELYTKIIDEIAEKVKAIRLSLRGEAFLHKKFIECIQYAKSKGIKEVSSLTSGSKLNPEFTAKAIEAGIDWITISIDGTGETYNKIRKPITFEQILERVRFIKEYKLKHGLSKPAIKVQGIWPAIRENPQLYYDTFAPIVDQVAYNPLIDYLSKDEDIVYLEEFTCPQQYQRLVIGADGLVMKCSNDEENDEVIGDINIESVHEVWHGANMTKHREMQKRDKGFLESSVCRKCYLPRKTDENEKVVVNGKKMVIQNYINRKQNVGE
jgi:radical SAM protein with 4Fe4S-binding SPASM domain